ncbi:MAG: peroxide stress protein YaaA [Myxococcota bacterium]|nr:peroxide stress protein YaaA [Myxococcota bacterium]
MLALLSPAKKLNDAPPRPDLELTQPALGGDIDELMKTTRKLKAPDLMKLMKISQNLADLNRDRFQSFETPFTVSNSTPAALTFAGDTYQGFDAATLEADDLRFAQDHVGILSGLYGLLRPLDLMQPYRLEMGTRLKNPRGQDLYAFWGSRITSEVNRLTEGHADRTVVNLASNEYFKAVKPKELEGGLITPVFKDLRDGKAKVISFLAKRARGAMARHIVQSRLQSPEGIKDFNDGGYAYRADLSTADQWVFIR